jgi:hypothetical protein
MSDGMETLAEVRARLAAEAGPVDADTETKMARLEELQSARRKDPKIEAEYKALRDELAAQIEKEGPRYFVAEDGSKMYAYAIVPEPVEVSISKLEAMDEAGDIPAGLIERVAPRHLNADEFKNALAKKELTRDQILEVTTLGKGTAYLKFVKADGGDD